MPFFPLDDHVHFPSFSSNVSRADGIDVCLLMPGPSVHGNISKDCLLLWKWTCEAIYRHWYL